MNIIYYGDNINSYRVVKEYIDINDKKEFMILDGINYLILDFNYYKKKDRGYVIDKLEDSGMNNFAEYKKYIILLNLNCGDYIQKYIKNHYEKLSNKNIIIITVDRVHCIINELQNSFHKIYIREGNKIYENEPLKKLVDQTYNIYDNDMDPLDIDKIKIIKEISYKVCKYSIPLKRYLYELLNKFLDNSKYTFLIKSRILYLISKVECDIHKSYRILIHIENLLVSIYDILITSYQ